VFNNELLHFCVVRYISIFIHSSSVVTSTSHSPTPSSDRDQFKICVNFLHVDVALDQGSTPVSANVLSDDISVNILIPHIAAVSTKNAWVGHSLISLFVPHLVELVLLMLLTDGDIKILCKKEPIL
jgi:hypothetical protein